MLHFHVLKYTAIASHMQKQQTSLYITTLHLTEPNYPSFSVTGM